MRPQHYGGSFSATEDYADCAGQRVEARRQLASQLFTINTYSPAKEICAPKLLVEEFVRMRNSLGNILHLSHNWLIDNVIFQKQGHSSTPWALCRNLYNPCQILYITLIFYKRKMGARYPGTFIKAKDV